MNIQIGGIAAQIIEVLQCTVDKPILICDEHSLTIKAFLQKINRRCDELVSQGVKPKQKVFISTQRGLAYWIDLLAVWRLGAIVIPLDASLGSLELDVLFEVVPPDYLISTDGSIVCQANNRASVDKQEKLAAILFTSGSTGRPKGVMLTHGAVLNNAMAVLEEINLSDKDTLSIATNFHFTSAICHFLSAMLTGATFVSTEQKLLHLDLVTYLKESNSTCFGGSPIQVSWIVECAPKVPLNLRWIMSSGDHLNAAIRKQLSAVMPKTVLYVVYGLTEVGGRLCLFEHHTACSEEQTGAVGKPIRNMCIEVLSEDMTPCQAGDVGEIYVSGAYIFSGYYHLHSEDLVDGRFKTGDFGYLTQSGDLCLMGRRDQVFKCAGKKVSTYPIYNALQAVSCFEDVVVMPIADSLLGHVPCVVYSLKAGHVFEKGAVLSLLRKTLPSNHIPRTYIEIDKLPRTGSGKPKYQEIRKLLTRAIVP